MMQRIKSINENVLEKKLGIYITFNDLTNFFSLYFDCFEEILKIHTNTQHFYFGIKNIIIHNFFINLPNKSLDFSDM